MNRTRPWRCRLRVDLYASAFKFGGCHLVRFASPADVEVRGLRTRYEKSRRSGASR
jgi:hypothetical protein